MKVVLRWTCIWLCLNVVGLRRLGFEVRFDWSDLGFCETGALHNNNNPAAQCRVRTSSNCCPQDGVAWIDHSTSLRIFYSAFFDVRAGVLLRWTTPTITQEISLEEKQGLQSGQSSGGKHVKVTLGDHEEAVHNAPVSGHWSSHADTTTGIEYLSN